MFQIMDNIHVNTDFIVPHIIFLNVYITRGSATLALKSIWYSFNTVRRLIYELSKQDGMEVDKGGNQICRISSIRTEQLMCLNMFKA